MLHEKDYDFIRKAREVIIHNYDEKHQNRTVGAAVLCGSGKIYIGVNVYSLHGVCAEQIAIGSAIAHGERVFVSIVAVRGKNGQEILSPCGNCRQVLNDYTPHCEVILSEKGNGHKVLAQELLPFVYSVE